MQPLSSPSTLCSVLSVDVCSVAPCWLQGSLGSVVFSPGALQVRNGSVKERNKGSNSGLGAQDTSTTSVPQDEM